VASWGELRVMQAPSASMKSAAPQRPDDDRLPCFATRPPAAATTLQKLIDKIKINYFMN
jgi:hypothetical protein